MDAIYSFSKTYKALILSRPSKICKSPYLADIKVFDEYENIGAVEYIFLYKIYIFKFIKFSLIF
jgi:hypothetical protein